MRSQQLSVEAPATCCHRSIADEWGAEANDWGCDGDDADTDSSACSAVSNCSPRLSPDGDQQQSTAEEIESKFELISISANLNTPQIEDPSVSRPDGQDGSDIATTADKGDIVLQSCYVYVIDEPCTDDDLEHEQELLKQYAQREGLDVSALHAGFASFALRVFS